MNDRTKCKYYQQQQQQASTTKYENKQQHVNGDGRGFDYAEDDNYNDNDECLYFSFGKLGKKIFIFFT